VNLGAKTPARLNAGDGFQLTAKPYLFG